MKDSIELTFFTPTYNRAYILPKLYESLCNQSRNDFIWLVIDDGSIDNTKELIDSWIDEKCISIKYIYQENGGKQRAHNRAVAECTTKLFCCVDSDDYLIETAVEDVLAHWRKIRYQNELSGIVAMRGTQKDTPIGNYLPTEIDKSSLSDLYKKHGFRGDTMLIFKTDILRMYPFVVCDGEKFMGEGYVYVQIDQKYKLSLLNKILYICHYLDDGYTNNTSTLIRNNPKGYLLEKEMEMKFEKSFKRKCIIAITYDSVCFLNNDIKRILSRPIYFWMSFPGYCLYKIRFRKNKE